MGLYSVVSDLLQVYIPFCYGHLISNLAFSS